MLISTSKYKKDLFYQTSINVGSYIGIFTVTVFFRKLFLNEILLFFAVIPSKRKIVTTIYICIFLHTHVIPKNMLYILACKGNVGTWNIPVIKVSWGWGYDTSKLLLCGLVSFLINLSRQRNRFLFFFYFRKYATTTWEPAISIQFLLNGNLSVNRIDSYF